MKQIKQIIEIIDNLNTAIEAVEVLLTKMELKLLPTYSLLLAIKKEHSTLLSEINMTEHEFSN